MRKFKITAKRVENAVKRQMFDLDNPGFCLKCGVETDGCEPDARKYKCHRCGEMAVYGAEEVMMMMGLG